jgi:hypothetical protein
VAWHPVLAPLLAFGCEDGSVGLANAATHAVSLFGTRHRGPVLDVVWQPGVVRVFSGLGFRIRERKIHAVALVDAMQTPTKHFLYEQTPTQALSI